MSRSAGNLHRLFVVVLALTLSACATAPPSAEQAASQPAHEQTAGQKADPWENWNRKVFAFNDALDDAVVAPIARGYRKVVPQFIRTGIGNVFGNIDDIWSTANHFLQGKIDSGLQMGMRVLTNTVFGFGGVIDIATELKLVKRSEDFGQTLGRWGVESGPYVLLPIFGPSTVRDTAGLVVDRGIAAPARYVDGEAIYWVTALELVQTRSTLLSTTELLGEVALDRYSFIRDAYLARRQDLVYDGAPPLEKLDDVPDDAPPEPAPASAPKP